MSTGAYRLPYPARSPVGEWQAAQPPGPLKYHLACGRIAGQHVLHVEVRRPAQRIVDAIPDEVRDVGDLRIGERRGGARLHRVPGFQVRPDGAAVAIAQHARRSNQVRAAFRAARARTVAGHAFGRVDLLPADDGGRVDAMPVRRAHVRTRPPPARPRATRSRRHGRGVAPVELGQVVEDNVELLGSHHRSARRLHRHDGVLPLRSRSAFYGHALDGVALHADAKERLSGFCVFSGELRRGRGLSGTVPADDEAEEDADDGAEGAESVGPKRDHKPR